jgi:hypothetical protein
MLLDDLGDCKGKDKRDDSDCLPPLRKIVSCSLNLDGNNGCKGGNVVMMHTQTGSVLISNLIKGLRREMCSMPQ